MDIKEKEILIEYCKKRIDESASYAKSSKIAKIALVALTAPSAQLLRPVELPEFKVHSNQPCWPSITVGLRDEEWIEALRQQGYEVKS